MPNGQCPQCGAWDIDDLHKCEQTPRMAAAKAAYDAMQELALELNKARKDYGADDVRRMAGEVMRWGRCA